MITDYHSQLYANELTLKAPLGTVERFATALFDSKVDLNPHQVDAALFAFKSPLSKGALLADEVGLGKTIEAGILIAQKWAERKRKVLIIVPANLRKQWLIELEDKFNLPAKILESKSFNEAIKDGNLNPFLCDNIVITSYAFARNKEAYIAQTPWDLAVIDEAHRLRNVYKSGNKVSKAIKNSLANTPKVLLTATPLQNNLMELYGLVSIIDPHVFGDEKSFRELFEKQNSESSFSELKKRLENICKRTLRKQVLKYIKYTKRHAYTQEFYSTKDEEHLYNQVSEYLRRETLKALPNSQRKLMTMILRKLLASSTYAISGTLERLIFRLEKILEDDKKHLDDLGEEIAKNFETADEYDDNFNDADNDSDDDESDESENVKEQEALDEHDKVLIKNEIEDLKEYLSLAKSIKQNSKGVALLKSLEKGFDMAQNLGGARKAVIFTESRRTQEYLWELLSENGYAGKIMLFNGTNTDKFSQEIFKNWKEKNPERSTASKSADMRTALVEHFRNDAQIMIATEAAAEGINLQFCSLVVNYDLPWNPQRIEQRIGRCHRYGQKHDVVVVNFLNMNNEADKRVYQLLNEKLHLFEGIFGASDEILGALGNGLDFEKRIAELYQKCRTLADIQLEFDFIQERFSLEIKENVRNARKKLIENFDAEVAERLNVWQENTHTTIDRLQALLWGLTKHEFDGRGVFFDEENMTFQMLQFIEFGFDTKKVFGIKRTSEHCEQYGVSHPLAQRLIERALNRDLPYRGILFDYERTKGKVSALEQLPKKSGKLTLSKLRIGDDEEHLVLSCIDDLGNVIEPEIARRLFNLKGKAYDIKPFDEKTSKKLDEVQAKHTAKIFEKNLERDTKIFDDEVQKLESWSEDRKASLEIKLKEIEKSIKEIKKEVRVLRTLEEKVALQRKQSAAENERMTLRKKLFIMQDEIDSERDRLISKAESAMRQTTQTLPIFSIEWRIV